MRKGVLASVAALATSAGVAFGQGQPPAAPSAYPMWGGAPMGPPPGAGPGMPMAAQGQLPNAVEMPHNGPVGPGAQGFEPTFGGQPDNSYGGAMSGPPQVHKAAGGPDHIYLDIEQLIIRAKKMPFNFPLVVAGRPDTAGVIGVPGVRVLYGAEEVDYDNINGLRVTGGFWCTGREWGFEGSGFIQEARSEIADFATAITSRELLGVPFINALNGQALPILVAFPGQFSGAIFTNSRLKMGGAEANILRSCVYCDMFKLNLLGGIRYLDHDETFQFTTRTVVPNDVFPEDPSLVDTFDEFACRNQFIGGQLGMQMELRCNRYFADIVAKCAVGNQSEELNIRGFTNTQISGVTTTVPAGIFALAGNSGNFTQNDWAYVPELTVKLGYQWTQRLSTYLGYNMLYISEVMRPTQQIDPVINPVFLPISQDFGRDFGPVRPINSFTQTDFWVQGVTFGLSIRY